MRFFLIDSMAYDSILRQLPTARPDVIEILPGPMPKLISRIKSKIKLPLQYVQFTPPGERDSSFAPSALPSGHCFRK